MTPEHQLTAAATCKIQSHALRGTITTLQTITRLLGSPASDLTEECKTAAQAKLQHLAALADWLDDLAGRLTAAA